MPTNDPLRIAGLGGSVAAGARLGVAVPPNQTTVSPLQSLEARFASATGGGR